MRIEKLCQAYDVDLKIVHFPLHPDTPAEGKPLAAMFGGEAVVNQRNAQMKERMDAEGLPYGQRTHSYNSRLAQELGAWADTQDGGDRLHEALYKAYFVDARNIGDPAVLLELVAAAGLDVDAARTVLDSRSFKDAVDADWMKSRQYGVTGVPTFVAGRQGVVGAQPYEALEQLVVQAGAKKRG